MIIHFGPIYTKSSTFKLFPEPFISSWKTPLEEKGHRRRSYSGSKHSQEKQIRFKLTQI